MPFSNAQTGGKETTMKLLRVALRGLRFGERCITFLFECLFGFALVSIAFSVSMPSRQELAEPREIFVGINTIRIGNRR
jgi:hypothetical protein